MKISCPEIILKVVYDAMFNSSSKKSINPMFCAIPDKEFRCQIVRATKCSDRLDDCYGG